MVPFRPRLAGWLVYGPLVLCCLQWLPGVLATRPLTCTRQGDLLAVHAKLRESLEHFQKLHREMVERRPKVLADHVKSYQVHAVAQDFLAIFESFHGLVKLIICPNDVITDPSSREATMHELKLIENINNMQLDVDLAARDKNEDFVERAVQVLRGVKQYSVELLENAVHSPEVALDWNEVLTACVDSVISRVIFPYMRIVTTSSPTNDSHALLTGVSLDAQNPASRSASYIKPVSDVVAAQEDPSIGEVAFGMLRSIATGGESLRLYSTPKGVHKDLCSPSASPILLQGTGGSPSWPRRWNSEAAGLQPRSLIDMLKQLEMSFIELSYNYLVLRPPGDGPWAEQLSCSGMGLQYDPALCLGLEGWGGSIFNVNIHPPYQAEAFLLRPRTGDQELSRTGEQVNILDPRGDGASPILSHDHLFVRIDWFWQQTKSPSPDLFFLHPTVHNCYAVEYLFKGAPLRPKILVIPINPLIPPPFEVMPDFADWWDSMRPSVVDLPRARPWVLHLMEDENRSTSEQSAGHGDWEDVMDEYLNASVWLPQCSLATVEAVLMRHAKKRFRYTFHGLDRGFFAVYLRQDLHKAVSLGREPEALGPSDAAKGAGSRLLAAWLQGWYCSPMSRLADNLELVAGPAMLRLGDSSISKKEKEAAICLFLDNHAIKVKSRNFDCEEVIRSTRTANDEGSDVALQQVGRHSCVSMDTRGWGNDDIVIDTMQDSADRCELYCARTRNCTFWTFDPSAVYGATLCWMWVSGRPDVFKNEVGWISGDTLCETGQRQDVARNVGPPQDHPPETAAPFSREWAAAPLREQLGMKYFIEAGHRGRCTQGLCECFPPYRGPLCELEDPGRFDDTRNYTAVLHYLTSNDPTDIEDFTHSLPLLWKEYNSKVDYPVVIFHDGLSDEHRERVANASHNRIWFAFVDDYLDIPEMLMKDPQQRALLDEVKWSLGYRGMCRFRSGTIFLQPVLRKFDYAMTLDTDGYFPASIEEDPIQLMHEGGYVYTWSHLLPDLPGAVQHFWDYSLMYMRMKSIDPRGTRILRHFVREDDLQWTYQLYMNDIEIVQLDWFRSDPYQDYFRYLDSVGGFWLYRWGDHAMRTIAVGMWLPQEKVYRMHIPYAHQNYCSCSDSHPDLSCLKEPDSTGKAWWTCVAEED